MDPSGVTALLTGAGRRIGAACAEALAAQGARIAIHCHRSEADAESLCAAIRQRGGQAAWFCADLADAGQTSALLEQVCQHFGPVRILVNNAAIFQSGSLRTTSQEVWERHLAVNLTAPFLLMQAFANSLAPTLTGKIINLIDQRVVRPHSGQVAYTVAKSALWTLTRMAAVELAPTIQVNAIAPGPILPSAAATVGSFQQVAAATPLGRAGIPQDIADTLLFLVRQEFITGEMICVDGGEHL